MADKKDLREVLQTLAEAVQDTLRLCNGLTLQDRERLETEMVRAFDLLAGNPITPEVVIHILGGVAELVTKPKGVQVTFRDYDITIDTGEEYSEEIWDESDGV